jgi:hypothetical protein
LEWDLDLVIAWLAATIAAITKQEGFSVEITFSNAILAF